MSLTSKSVRNQTDRINQSTLTQIFIYRLLVVLCPVREYFTNDDISIAGGDDAKFRPMPGTTLFDK